MFTRKASLAAALLALGAGAALAQSPNLGQPITEAEIGEWGIHAMPDGTGLPPGSGTPAQGKVVYAQKCAVCHGPDGKGGPNSALVDNPPITAIDSRKTIANFWGYATTVFDFTRRAMPWPTPRTLTNDEVYALTAWILWKNDIVGRDAPIDAATLPQVMMPARNRFQRDDRETSPRVR